MSINIESDENKSINSEDKYLNELKEENGELRKKIRNLYTEIIKIKLENKTLSKYKLIYDVRLEHLRLTKGNITYEEASELDLKRWWKQRKLVFNSCVNMKKEMKDDLEIIKVNLSKFIDDFD